MPLRLRNALRASPHVVQHLEWGKTKRTNACRRNLLHHRMSGLALLSALDTQIDSYFHLQ